MPTLWKHLRTGLLTLLMVGGVFGLSGGVEDAFAQEGAAATDAVDATTDKAVEASKDVADGADAGTDAAKKAAGEDGKEDDEGSIREEFLKGIEEVFGVLVRVFTFFAMLSVGATAKFFGNELITGPAVLEAITPLWVLVRNLVNIGAVLVILFIAGANLFTFGKGQWSIKEKLPKLIIALVLINFSMLACKIVLDAVYVGTVAIFSISDISIGNQTPRTILSRKCPPGEEGASCEDAKDEQKGFHEEMNNVMCPDWKKKMPDDKRKASLQKQIKDVLEKDPDADTAVAEAEIAEINARDKEREYCLFYLDIDLISDDNPLEAANSGRPGENIMAAFANYVMYLEALPKFKRIFSDEDGEVSIEGSFVRVLDSTIFSMIMGFLYAIGLIAILIALIARMVIMWFVIILSPVLMAGSILGIGAAGTFTDKVVNNLVMPLKIALIMAVSFIMISHLVQVSNTEIIDLPDFMILGSDLQKLGRNMLDILWKIVTIIVFWMSLWWAIDGNAGSFITEKLKNGTAAVGETVKNAAMSIPVMPVGKKDDKGNQPKVGLGSLFSLPNMMKNASADRLSDQEGDLQKALLPSDGNDSAASKSVEGLRDDIRKNKRDWTVKGGGQNMIDTIGGENFKHTSDPKVIKALQEKLRKDAGDDKELLAKIDKLDQLRNYKGDGANALRRFDLIKDATGGDWLDAKKTKMLGSSAKKETPQEEPEKPKHPTIKGSSMRPDGSLTYLDKEGTETKFDGEKTTSKDQNTVTYTLTRTDGDKNVDATAFKEKNFGKDLETAIEYHHGEIEDLEIKDLSDKQIQVKAKLKAKPGKAKSGEGRSGDRKAGVSSTVDSKPVDSNSVVRSTGDSSAVVPTTQKLRRASSRQQVVQTPVQEPVGGAESPQVAQTTSAPQVANQVAPASVEQPQTPVVAPTEPPVTPQEPQIAQTEPQVAPPTTPEPQIPPVVENPTEGTVVAENEEALDDGEDQSLV